MKVKTIAAAGVTAGAVLCGATVVYAAEPLPRTNTRRSTPAGPAPAVEQILLDVGPLAAGSG